VYCQRHPDTTQIRHLGDGFLRTKGSAVTVLT
jgi:hypothetical protein